MDHFDSSPPIETRSAPSHFSLSSTRNKRRRDASTNISGQPTKRPRLGNCDQVNDSQVERASVGLFTGVQQGHIHGGVYNLAGRDCITIHNHYTYGPPSQLELYSTSFTSQQERERRGQHARQASFHEFNNSVGFFPHIQSSLNFIRSLLSSETNREYQEIVKDLDELHELVRFSWAAYQACDGEAVVGKLMRGTIESCMHQCIEATLPAIHQTVMSLVNRSLPPLPWILRVLVKWWIGSNLEEISVVRSALQDEGRQVAEWLCCLKQFCWDRRLLLDKKRSGFTWNALEEFIESGPKLLKEMHVAKIIVIEPLQGEALSIPLRFLESFEDIHQIIHFACEGTPGHPFIEARRYQLDESKTNVTVPPDLFRSFMRDGKAFEVTIIIKSSSLTVTDCPRCGTRCDTGDNDCWIQCTDCRIHFNSRVSSRSSGLQTRAYRNTSGEPHAHGDTNLQEDHSPVRGGQDDFAPATIGNPWTLFRRMRIEILRRGVLDFEECHKLTGLHTVPNKLKTPLSEASRDSQAHEVLPPFKALIEYCEQRPHGSWKLNLPPLRTSANIPQSTPNSPSSPAATRPLSSPPKEAITVLNDFKFVGGIGLYVLDKPVDNDLGAGQLAPYSYRMGPAS